MTETALHVDGREEVAPAPRRAIRPGPRAALRLGRPWSWLAPLGAVAWGPGWEVARHGSDFSPFWVLSQVHDLFLYAVLTLSGLVLVAAGLQRAWVVPSLVVLFTSPVIRVGGTLMEVARGRTSLPHDYWGFVVADLLDGAILTPRPWVGTAVVLGLLLAPAVALRRSVPPAPPAMWTRHRVGALLAVLAAVAMVAYVWEVFAPYGGAALWEAPELLVAVLVGAGVGMRRGWWPWLHLVVGLALGGTLVQVVLGLRFGAPGFDPLSHLLRGGTLAGAALVAALWGPLTSALERMEDRPGVSLAALNILNLVDAAATELALEAGRAVELNPFVRLTGWPLKVALVGTASLLLYRYRPGLLVWPTLVFVVLTVWHLVGLAFGT